MEFHFSNFIGNYGMWCKTEEEAEDFRRVMHEDGRTWCDGISYLNISEWNGHKEDTVYCFNEGMFDNIDNVEEDGYTILEWSKYMKL